jgi:DNA-binding transcriptional MerR regulator
MSSNERTYRVHEFAVVAGVTVKALRHYDRLGLLQPARTNAGHRLYTNADRVRLHRITSLQFIGIPLKRIGKLLDEDTTSLSLVSEQRRALEERRRLLDHAIQALTETEAVAADPVAASRLIIEASWAKAEADHEARERDGTAIPFRVTERKRMLFRDVTAVRHVDASSPEAQTLISRWRALLADETGRRPRNRGRPRS